MRYFVYIIESEKEGTLYVGQTNNIDDRLGRYNAGRSTYTRTRMPWRLLRCEEYASRSEAVQREKTLKSLKRRVLLLEIVAAQQ